MMSPEQLLQKAILQSDTTTSGAKAGGGDFGGAGQAALSIEQVTQFLELMTAGQVMLPDVRTVTSGASKWQESIIEFSARIARPGVEATRLADSDRVKPNTGITEISTVLLRAEIPISDEAVEDNVAAQGIVASIERLIADRFGYDVEELMVNGDKTSGDAYLALLDGWLVQAKNGKSGAGGTANPVDGSAFGQDYQEIFRVLLSTMPDRFRRRLSSDGRFYVPDRTLVKYRDELASRGTALGDANLLNKTDLKYQDVSIVGVPNIAVSGGGTSSILLANRNNLYAGFHRRITFESWRDPREGVTSFIVTARVDAEVAVPAATAVAYNVDVSV